jgi:hypothetical protein
MTGACTLKSSQRLSMTVGCVTWGRDAFRHPLQQVAEPSAVCLSWWNSVVGFMSCNAQHSGASPQSKFTYSNALDPESRTTVSDPKE